MNDKVPIQIRFPKLLKERIRIAAARLTKAQGGARYPMSTFITTACMEKLERDGKRVKRQD